MRENEIGNSSICVLNCAKGAEAAIVKPVCFESLYAAFIMLCVQALPMEADCFSNLVGDPALRIALPMTPSKRLLQLICISNGNLPELDRKEMVTALQTRRQ